MSKDSYNNFGVPHYAASDTPAIRPKAPRELPADLLSKKCNQGRALQYIYKHIRDNWREGDQFVVTGLRKRIGYKDTISRFDGRRGSFVRLDTVGAFTMVRVRFDGSDSDKSLMGPVEFYWHAYKPEELCEVRYELSKDQVL